MVLGTTGSAQAVADNVWVCKYTGKPEVGEAAHHVVPQSAVDLGEWFKDGQTWSIAVMEVTASNDKEEKAEAFELCPPYAPPGVVAPAAPYAVDADCEVDGSLVVPDQPTGVLVTQDPSGTGPGSYTVTFSPAEGYEFPEGTQTEYTLVVAAAIPYQSEEPEGACYVPPNSHRAVAQPPTVVQSPACEVEGSYTIPETEGVQYLLDGEEIAAGTYSGPESGTVTAEALEGYRLVNPEFSFALAVAPAVACQTPPPTPTGTLQWLKVDETGAPLAGAAFEVCPVGGSCRTVVDNESPDVDSDPGEFRMSGLALGSYTITETEAPDGYVRELGSQTVTLTAGAPTNTGEAVPEFVNAPEAEAVVYGDLGWVKVDDQQQPLAGATFEVCHVADIDGTDLTGDCLTVVDNQSPDSDAGDGEFLLADVPLGAWTVTETEAPAGYEMAEGAVDVVLTEATPTNMGDGDAPVFVNAPVPDEVLPAEAEKPKPAEPVAQPDEVLGTEAAVPTSIDAGLPGAAGPGGTSSPLGQGLVASGLLLVALAGVMQLGRRDRGVHEA